MEKKVHASKKIKQLLAIIALLIYFQNGLKSQTSLVVTSLADNSNAGTLRWAIGQANATAGGIYDAITFNVTGTILLTSHLPTITQAVTITGPGQNNLTIDGNNLYRVIYNTSSIAISISDMTLTKGYTGTIDQGGGLIWNSYGTLTISNVTFSNMTLNVSQSAAFCQKQAGVTTFNNCTFTNLNAGINANHGSTPTTTSSVETDYQNRVYVNYSTFSNNIRGIETERFTKIDNCTFTGNTTSAASLQGLNRQTVTNSTFSNNGIGINTSCWMTASFVNLTALNQLIEYNTFTSNSTAISLGNNWDGVSNGQSPNKIATVRNNCFISNTNTISGVAGYSQSNNTTTTITAITGSSTVCLGATITLGNTTAGGTWSSSNTAIATVNSSGVVTPISAGNVDILYSISSGSCSGSVSKPITVNAPTFSTTLASGNYVWLGTTSTDWSTLTNWRQYNGTALVAATSIPTSSDVTIVPPNGTCVLNQPAITSGVMSTLSVIVETGAVFNMGAGTLEVSGNITNNGTINPTTGTLKLMGGNTSTISGSGTFNFNNLTIEKTSNASINLSVPITVKGILTLTSGTINNPSALLTVGVSSAAPGSLSYTSGTITGKMKRYFNASATTGTGGLFPVGTANYNRFAKVNFTSSPGTNQFLTVEYKPGAPLDASNAPLYTGLPATISGQLVQVYSADGYWQIDPTDNNYASTICTTPYNLTLNANNLTNFNNPSTVRIIKAAGSNTLANHHVSWQGAGTHTPNATTNATVAEISSTNCTGFSWFNIGTWNDQALPVELTSFSSECKESGVDINWQTATEHNSAHFTVEKSRDGLNWMHLASLEAAGNSSTLINYSYIDAEKSGIAYYRLQQVDQDGTEKTYGPISSSCEAITGLIMKTYPNPCSELFTINIESEVPMVTAQIILKDVFGRIVASKAVSIVAGTTQVEFLGLNVESGIYSVSLEENGTAIKTVKQVMH